MRIKSCPPTTAVVCSECDRVWSAPRKVGLNNDAELEAVLLHAGLSGSWEDIECIHQGVFWDQLEADYQSILSRKHLA